MAYDQQLADALAEIERLRAALTSIIERAQHMSDPVSYDVREIARAALTNEQIEPPLIHVGTDGQPHQGRRSECPYCHT